MTFDPTGWTTETKAWKPPRRELDLSHMTIPNIFIENKPAPVTCSTVLARVKFDRKRGFTTSEAAKDFILRTCCCGGCKVRRRTQGVR